MTVHSQYGAGAQPPGGEAMRRRAALLARRYRAESAYAARAASSANATPSSVPSS